MDMRFIGPNCVGLARGPNKMNGTFLKTEAPAGGLALVSQSGALCSAIADWAAPHNLGFSSMFSLGNSTDVDFGDVLDLLANDPETKAILLYVEGIRNARSFISAPEDRSPRQAGDRAEVRPPHRRLQGGLNAHRCAHRV